LNSNMLSVHELIDKMTKSCGVKVFNSTIGGNLEIYNRVQLESLY